METDEYKPASTEKRIKVLMYHKIVEDEDIRMKHWTFVSTKQFKKHLSLLEQWGFTPITFKDYLFYKDGDFNLPKKSVIITFDDGFESVYNNAFPMLKKFGWNAVVFVLADKNITTDVWDKKCGFPASNLLRQEQIIEMNNSGFEIGSHSMSHADLTSISLRAAGYEISYSKEVLENLINTEIVSFCYPFGSMNKKIQELVHHANYELACGVYSGNPKFWTNKFDIRRLTISNTTNSLQFGIKLLAPYEYFEWYGSRITKITKRKTIEEKMQHEYSSVINDRNYINV